MQQMMMPKVNYGMSDINTSLIIGEDGKLQKVHGFEHYLENHMNIKKAITSQTSGSGKEFVPTPTSPRIIEFLYLENWARQAFGTWTISEGYILAVPKEDTGLTPNNPDLQAGEITEALGSAAAIREEASTTSSITLTLTTLHFNMQVQDKALAYSIGGRGPRERRLREHLAKSLKEVEEDAFVNGDIVTGAGNINNAYNSTNHKGGQSATKNEHLLAFDGLRASAAAAVVDAGGDSLTTTDFTNAFRNLGKYGVDKRDVLILVSMDVHAQMLRFTQLETLETYGPRATIFSGEIGKFFGATVIMTDKMPATVGFHGDTLTNSVGVRSSSLGTNSFTEVLVMNRKSPMIGVPADTGRAFSLKMKEFPEHDRIHLFAKEDVAFNLAYDDAVCRIYHIATS